MATKRITLTIPEEMVTQLDRMSQSIKVSRSSVVVGMLEPALAEVMSFLDTADSYDPESDAVRGQTLSRAAYDQLTKIQSSIEAFKDDINLQ
jgi:hypothetical protein